MNVINVMYERIKRFYRFYGSSECSKLTPNTKLGTEWMLISLIAGFFKGSIDLKYSNHLLKRI